jgi:hypothetical protein
VRNGLVDGREGMVDANFVHEATPDETLPSVSARTGYEELDVLMVEAIDDFAERF